MFLPDPSGKRNARTKWIWAATIIVLIAIGFSFNPIYKRLKDRRASGFVQEAEELIREEQWQAALLKVQAALQLNPSDLRANRLMARLLTGSGHPQALQYWNRVFSGGGDQPGDRMEVVEAAIRFDRLEVAELFLKQALEEKPVAPGIYRAAAYYSDAKGDSPRAIQFARAALQADPADRTSQLLLAKHLSRSGAPEDTEAAKATLWSLIREQPTNAAPAIQLLVTASNLDREELQELLRHVEKLPTNSTQNWNLLKLDLATRLVPERKDEMIGETIRASSQTPEHLLNVSRWLNQKREYKKVLQTVKLDQALQSKDLFLVYADALAGDGQWTELDKIFSRSALPVDALLVDLYRARIATELKDNRRADGYWEQVHRIAAKQPETVAYVAEYAERIGQIHHARKAYRQLAKEPATARAAYSALVRLAEKEDNIVELRKVVRELGELYPKDPQPQNDLAYLNLLLNEEVESSTSVAEKLVEAHPKLLAYRTTLALAHLRGNRTAQAKKAYENFPFQWNDALPGWQAVYVAVMGAAGETEVARKMAALIEHNRLKTAELEMIKAWL